MNSITSHRWQDGRCSLTLQLAPDDLVALFRGLELVGDRMGHRLPRQPRLGPDEYPEFNDYIEANGVAAEPLVRLRNLMVELRAVARDQALDLISPCIRSA